MTKVTITIESNMEELGSVLDKLKELGEISGNIPNSLVNHEWTRERVLGIWADLSEGVKEALGVIARNDERSWEEQLRIMGKSGQVVGGSLSSLGAQLRNHGLKGITKPLSDNDAYGYKLLPIWKEIVLERTSG